MQVLLPAVLQLAVAAVLPAVVHPLAVQPNIYIFMADDLNALKQGPAYSGNQYVKTPTIDTFAKNGVDFTQMFAPIAMCAPSRVAMHTGTP